MFRNSRAVCSNGGFRRLVRPPYDRFGPRERTWSAIDSKLRGCDVVAPKVEDVTPTCYTVERATVWQRKTGRPVKFELTEQIRQAIDDHLRASGKKPGEFLFTSRRHNGRCMTTRQHAHFLYSISNGFETTSYLGDSRRPTAYVGSYGYTTIADGYRESTR